MAGRRVAAVLAVAAVMLVACGSGGDQEAGETTVPATVSQAQVPSGFDNGKGWSVEGTETTAYAFPSLAPQAGLILLLANENDSAHIVARETKTGATRWTGAAVPEPDARLFVTSENGKEYAVLVGQRHAYVYDAASTGDSVAAQRDFAIPGRNDVTAQGDGHLLIDYAGGVAVLDAASGQVTRYGPKVVAVTAKGPVERDDPALPAPAGATGAAQVLGSPDGKTLVAQWGSAADRVWSVHDGTSGQVLASVTCRGEDGATPSVSVGGRYLIAGPVAFDLQARKGFCFGDKGTDLISADPDGTVYGANDTEPVTASTVTGSVSQLDEDERVPDLIAADVALFGTATDGGEAILVYPRS
ncbi:MBL fold metallo-hydrolase [Amycolatopsis acidicola]|uniref:MBL fold metallo-hydrolase n=1 Tax=Amycolatopsis acidicola TaxID=2596893 RepID=A0A5N0UWH0_9PSEU|nr:MBL fold metallo-hydrolase [Amycolatopsis acidicola]KAA9157106.1 MBL fold metallo-hydrolase [Amycolatopsis acidicola]